MAASRLRIAYFASGPGSGTTYRGLALFKAVKRAGLPVDFAAFISQSDYTWIYPEDEMDIYAPESRLATPCAVLRWGMGDFRPDVLITSYSYGACQEIKKEYPNLRMWLLMRGFKNMEGWLHQSEKPEEWFKPEMWEGIAGIEPGVAGQIEAITGAKALDVPPVLATWPDELQTDRAKLKELVPEKWPGEYRRGVRLVANNGVVREEMEAFKDYTRANPFPGATLTVTQNPLYRLGINRKLVARYLPLVDELVAKPGYNLYWEWLKYGNPNGKATWIPVPKSWDIQEERLTLGIDRDAPNGSDVLIKAIYG